MSLDNRRTQDNLKNLDIGKNFEISDGDDEDIEATVTVEGTRSIHENFMGSLPVLLSEKNGIQIYAINPVSLISATPSRFEDIVESAYKPFAKKMMDRRMEKHPIDGTVTGIKVLKEFRGEATHEATGYTGKKVVFRGRAYVDTIV
jgi:hypothetical protein